MKKVSQTKIYPLVQGHRRLQKVRVLSLAILNNGCLVLQHRRMLFHERMKSLRVGNANMELTRLSRLRVCALAVKSAVSSVASFVYSITE